MMDSQENTLELGKVEEAQQTPEVAAEVNNDESKPAKAEKESLKTYKTKKEVIDRLKDIVSSDEAPSKEEIDYLKTSFYKIHIAERDAQQKAYIEDGGDPEKYQVVPDEEEEIFKAEMGVIKERRAKLFEEQEKQRQSNLEKKCEIIEKIKAMATSPDEANKSYNAFKELQQQWKEIGSVPPEKSNEVWRNYQLYVEQFYDLLNLNREAREYDFKKNLEAKTKLCEMAEALTNATDVISAFHQLQKLHQDYLLLKTCANKYGLVSRQLLPPSISVIKSTLKNCVPRRKTTL